MAAAPTLAETRVELARLAGIAERRDPSALTIADAEAVNLAAIALMRPLVSRRVERAMDRLATVIDLGRAERVAAARTVAETQAQIERLS